MGAREPQAMNASPGRASFVILISLGSDGCVCDGKEYERPVPACSTLKLLGKWMTIDNPQHAIEPALQGTRGKSRRVSSWVLGAFLGAVLTIILIGAVVWLSTGLGLFRLLGNLRGGRTQFNVDQPTVVHQIQQLQRLETVSYSMDKIISGEHDNAYLPKFLAGDRLLLVVHGEVVGGINLAGLQPGDVQIQGQKVWIHLPPAEVLSTRIDNAKTRVYSRDTGLFSSPDPNLESEVREEAERQLQQAALQDGILRIAADNARNTISGMLKGFGFLEVNTR
jgi:hypothetical protein